MTPSLDWQQLVLALVTGLVSAPAHEGISQFGRTRYWHPVRESLIKESWHEAVWVWVVLTHFKSWRVPMPTDVDDRSLFEGHASELREIRTSENRAVTPWTLDGSRHVKRTSSISSLSCDHLRLIWYVSSTTLSQGIRRFGLRWTRSCF